MSWGTGGKASIDTNHKKQETQDPEQELSTMSGQEKHKVFRQGNRTFILRKFKVTLSCVISIDGLLMS
jgi:hypothetical protein